MSDEIVMCVSRDDLDRIQIKQGFTPASFDLAVRIGQLGQVGIKRDVAEKDETHKQLIPYVIIRCGSRIIRYERKGSEDRLHGLLSIGSGGHIAHTDKTYNVAVCREIKEELGIEVSEAPPVVGVVNVDDTPVDRVHIGIVHLLDILPESNLSFDELHNPVWVGREEALKELERYETWSQLCLKNLADMIFPASDSKKGKCENLDGQCADSWCNCDEVRARQSQTNPVDVTDRGPARAMPRIPRQGWRVFQCACGWVGCRASRDFTSPSVDTCKNCKEEVRPVASWLDLNLPVDSVGNLVCANEDKPLYRSVGDMMTEDELSVLTQLADAWNAFVLLPEQSPDDVTEFRRLIHQIEHLIMIRPIRRRMLLS